MAELCPLDSRRSTAEIWSKLVLAHFTTIIAICHLLSIRGDGIISLKPFFFLICPLLICVQYATALILLSVLYGVYLFTRSPSYKRALMIALRSLFLPVRLGHEYTAVANPETVAPDPLDEFFGRLRQRVKTLGRVLVLSVVGVQCVGSIVLAARRLDRGAATQSDQRVLELACGGLLVIILSFPPLVWQRSFTDQDINLRQDDLEETDQRDCVVGWLLQLIRWLGGVADRTCSVLDDDAPKDAPERCLCAFWLEAMMLFIVFNLRKTFSLSTGFHEIFAGKIFSHGSAGADTLEATLLIATYGLTAIFLLALAISELWSISKPRRPPSIKSFLLSLCQIYGPFFLAALGAVILFVPVLFFLSPAYNVFVICRQWEVMITELLDLAAWPTDRACPLLWVDGVASWVWNLAYSECIRAPQDSIHVISQVAAGMEERRLHHDIPK